MILAYEYNNHVLVLVSKYHTRRYQRKMSFRSYFSEERNCLSMIIQLSSVEINLVMREIVNLVVYQAQDKSICNCTGYSKHVYTS